MGIHFRIDRKRRVVLVEFKGIVTAPQVFEFQRKVWTRPAVSGFRELVDTRPVRRIEYESAEKVRELADLAATMDPVGRPTKLAIVATDEFVLNLGRLYSAFRALNPRSSREVRTFTEMGPALKWLRVPKTALVRPPRKRRLRPGPEAPGSPIPEADPPNQQAG